MRGQHQEETFTWGTWGSHGQLAAAASGHGRDVCDLPRPAPEWSLGCWLPLPWAKVSTEDPGAMLQSS